MFLDTNHTKQILNTKLVRFQFLVALKRKEFVITRIVV